MGEMRDSDWSRPNLLRSDWLPIIVAICTTFEPFLTDFEEVLRFLHLGGGGVCRKRRPWAISLIIEDPAVSYTSKVEIPVSSYS